jgi:hypothetical protein
MAAVATRHDRIVREQVEAAGGRVFKTVGEAHRAAFADPVAALSATVAIQRAAGAEPWASQLPIEVCLALHSGACPERDGDYAGPVVNRAARLLAGRLPGGIGFRDLGEQRLRDLGRAERVFQVTGPACPRGPLRRQREPAGRQSRPGQPGDHGRQYGPGQLQRCQRRSPERDHPVLMIRVRDDDPGPPFQALGQSRSLARNAALMSSHSDAFTERTSQNNEFNPDRDARCIPCAICGKRISR